MPSETPVLIVGAGPSGLAAAIELARRGVPTLLVERRLTRSAHPRATVLSLRSMELIRLWGLEAQVRERSDEVFMRMLLAETMAEAAGGSPIEVGYPSREQSAVLSPTAPACAAQDEVEPILLAHLQSLPAARVELGVELTGLVGTRATLRDVRTGETRTVGARYVVAADGAHSAVRRALGVELIGPEGVLEGHTTLFRAPLWDVVAEHRYLIYTVATGVFIPAGGGDRWLYAPLDDSTEPPRPITELIRESAGVPDLEVRVERSQRFSSAAQLAKRFRAGSVFLTGDAAHRVTPRGGTGLNIALHDGFDLGWKLAWVLRGWSGPELLDTYEAERRPVAAHAVTRSADPGGSRRAPEEELHADLGGRIPHAWAGSRSTLDLLGPGLTLFAGPEGEGWALPSGPPVAVRRLDPVAAGAVGAPGRTALLVRPDGKPAGVLPAVTARTSIEALAA